MAVPQFGQVIMDRRKRHFLTVEDERAKLAELEVEFEREAAWRKSESLLAIARLQAMPQRPREPQDRIAAAPARATSLIERAASMRTVVAGMPLVVGWLPRAVGW